MSIINIKRCANNCCGMWVDDDAETKPFRSAWIYGKQNPVNDCAKFCHLVL